MWPGNRWKVFRLTTQVPGTLGTPPTLPGSAAAWAALLGAPSTREHLPSGDSPWQLPPAPLCPPPLPRVPAAVGSSSGCTASTDPLLVELTVPRAVVQARGPAGHSEMPIRARWVGAK